MIHFKPLEKHNIIIIIELMVDFYAIDGYPIDIEKSQDLLGQFIDNPALGMGWLIYWEEKVVGYLILTFVFSFEYQGKIAFLDELYVTEKDRGKGIGSEAIAFIKTESHKLSLKLIYLEVETHNEKAQKLYLANGFESHKRQLMQYKIK